MGNIVFRTSMTAENIGKTQQGRVLREFLQLVAPKRPEFKFVVPNSSECYVYHRIMDITCKDMKSINYVGQVGFTGASRRGGKGYRPTIIVVPAGKPRRGCLETVVTKKAANIFLDQCRTRDIAVVVAEAVSTAAAVVAQMRSESKFQIINSMQNKVLARLSELELATYLPPLLRGEGTPGLALNHIDTIIEAAEQIQQLVAVFGENYGRAAYVVVVGETYAVKHKDAITEYISDTLPPHIACAIGMLKLAGAEHKLLPGYGVLISSGVYAVSIEEVGV